MELALRVPGRIRFDVGYLNGMPMAGVAVFVINARVVCSFYICHTEHSKPFQCLTLTLLKSMECYQSDGFLFYDMGTSSVGMKARQTTFIFKEGFSAESYIRETLEWTSGE